MEVKEVRNPIRQDRIAYACHSMLGVLRQIPGYHGAIVIGERAAVYRSLGTTDIFQCYVSCYKSVSIV